MAGLLRDKDVALLLTCCLVFGFVVNLCLLLVPLYTLAISDSPLILAVVVATFPLCSLFLSLASAACSDHFGRRTVILSGFCLLSCGCLVLVAARSYHLLLVGQILLALGDVGFWIAGYTFLTELAPVGGQYALQGLGGAALQVGTILGPLAGGYLAALRGFPTAFALAGALALFGCLLVALMEENRVRAAHDASLSTSLAEYHLAALSLLSRNRAILWANLFDSIAHLPWLTVGGSFYLAFLTTAGFSSSAAGLLVSAQLTVATLGQLSLGHFGKRAPIVSLAVAATLIGAITLGITPLLGNIPLIVLVGCLAGVSRIEGPVLIGFVAENTNPAERALAIAVLNVTWGLLSPLVLFALAFIVQRSALGSAFYVTGAGVTLCCILLWCWAKKNNL